MILRDYSSLFPDWKVTDKPKALIPTPNKKIESGDATTDPRRTGK
jgi:CDP-glycerol glycerophosphotransferase (TagB/SpsB family)